MDSKTKILIVEHDPNDIELLRYELKKGGISFVSEVVQNEADYGEAIRSFHPDIILSDFSLPTFDGPTAFKIREEIAPDTPFIFVSGNIGEENSIEFIKNGVTDYALKDKLFTLTSKVKRALKEAGEKLEKSKAEEERILSEKRLARAQQVAHMGSWEYDLATESVVWSDEACRIYGVVIEQNHQTFKSWLSFIHPEDVDAILTLVKENRNLLLNSSFTHRIIRHDGSIRHIYSESKFELDANKNPTGIYGIAYDVTDRKDAELERTKITSDLIQRNQDLEQFTYIISHNLRAPVANIQGAISIICDPEFTQEIKDELCVTLKESITKLDDVVKDLNSILQVKSEINEIKELVIFSELVADIKSSLSNLISLEHIELDYSFSEVDEFLTLKGYLYSIFYNLIYNSIKYRQPDRHGIIAVGSQLFTDHIELIFTDNGMGIDLNTKGDQVFGLYKRFHPSIEGKGMGLFMVKTQVEILGGKISIKSEVDRGTEFRIRFER